MISPEQGKYLLRKAYVPEHLISLMAGISGGEPFLEDDFVFFAKDDWLIFVGYPLDHDFQAEVFSTALQEKLEKFSPARAWFIAPEIPPSLSPSVHSRETDEYFKLELKTLEIKQDLLRAAGKASSFLRVERSRRLSKEHGLLTDDFLKRENPPPRIKELFWRMPGYVSHSPTALVLSAYDPKDNLSAYYVLELAAEKFATYVVGCFSREHYVAHASDLLFLEMIYLTKENKKDYIHLGLGVNDGIRRFKRKWGGIPFLKYESGALATQRKGPLSWIQAFETKLLPWENKSRG